MDTSNTDSSFIRVKSDNACDILQSGMVHAFHEGGEMHLETEQILMRNLKTEMRRIRQRINKEKSPARKTEMVKAYRKMSKVLSVKADRL